MLPAEMLLMGQLMADGKGLTVHVKAVETRDGEIRLSEDVYSESDGGDDFSYQVAGLMMKVKQRFPLVDGELLKIAGNKAVLNVGSRHGVSVGTRFVVIQKSGQGADWRAGSVREVEGKMVQVAVDRVEKDNRLGRILPPAAAGAVKEGDYVYADDKPRHCSSVTHPTTERTRRNCATSSKPNT